MAPPHHLKHKEKAHLGITGSAEMQNSQGSTPCELALGMQQGDWLWVCTLQRVGPYLSGFGNNIVVYSDLASPSEEDELFVRFQP